MLESLGAARLQSLRGRLREWLVGSAYPRWSAGGVDRVGGGFAEALDPDGRDTGAARRARVQPRQVFAFAAGPRLGWVEDAPALVRHGLEYIERRYRRPDGLYRTLIAADGRVLDDGALLYDQAFVLLGFAAAASRLGDASRLEPLALELLARIESLWRLEAGGFRSGESEPPRIESNPHMHLLEACLAWHEVGSDPAWCRLADEIVDLALRRFIRPSTGALHEAFTVAWEPAPEAAGRIVEPGHQYEWARLILRSPQGKAADRRQAALGLIDRAEEYGVRQGLAVNELSEDLRIHDASARLWPQTERLGAAVTAWRLTADPKYLDSACEAAQGVFGYFDADVPGLWSDLKRADGQLVAAPAYASTFYHLVGANLALDVLTPFSEPAWQCPDQPAL